MFRQISIRDADALGTFRCGAFVRREHVWEDAQFYVRSCVSSAHDGTLVEIARDDHGANYTAPGHYTVKTRGGRIFHVEVRA